MSTKPTITVEPRDDLFEVKVQGDGRFMTASLMMVDETEASDVAEDLRKTETFEEARAYIFGYALSKAGR